MKHLNIFYYIILWGFFWFCFFISLSWLLSFIFKLPFSEVVTNYWWFVTYSVCIGSWAPHKIIITLDDLYF
jgi:hypothetical protein